MRETLLSEDPDEYDDNVQASSSTSATRSSKKKERYVHPEDLTVYHSQKGECYHYFDNCGGLSNANRSMMKKLRCCRLCSAKVLIYLCSDDDRR